jgi:exonuclease SbcC
MIKRIELVNFMSHEHTVIEPSDGLTVLIGPNNCGKSAVVSALQVLCSNSPSTYVLRHGAKECKIIVETDTGDRIVWSRKKSGSPKYEINKEPFDRLNRKPPPALHKILRLPTVQADKETYDVHFGEQRSPIFLLGDKEKAAAQFFASSSDAIRLVEMQTLHKNKVRKSNHEVERLKAERAILEAEIEILTPIEKIRDAAKECQKQYDELQESAAKAKLLQSTVKQLNASLLLNAVLAARGEVLAVVPAPPKISPTAGIKSVLLQLKKLQQKKSHVEKSKDALDVLCNPPTINNTTVLKRSIEQLQSYGLQSVTFQKNLSILKRVKPLPPLQKVNGLKATIDELSLTENRQKALVNQSKRLAKIDEPPKLDSPEKLLTIIASLDKVLLKHEQLNQLLASTNKDLDAAEQAFEAWIKQHPQCPTCGTELSTHALPCGPSSETEVNDAD